MSEGLIGVIIGGVLVTVSGAVVELIRASRVAELDKQKRRDDRRLGLDQFQRETLLAVQDAVNMSARATGKLHLADLRAYRQTGEWGKALVGEEIAESDRLGRLALSTLQSRIADEDLRVLVTRLTDASGAVGAARDAETADKALLAVVQLAEAIIEKSGEAIRRSFLAE